MSANQIDYYAMEKRLFEKPDGSKELVNMERLHWEQAHFLFVVEGITQTEISKFSIEEMELQQWDFSTAVQVVTNYLYQRWK